MLKALKEKWLTEELPQQSETTQSRFTQKRKALGSETERFELGDDEQDSISIQRRLKKKRTCAEQGDLLVNEEIGQEVSVVNGGLSEYRGDKVTALTPLPTVPWRDNFVANINPTDIEFADDQSKAPSKAEGSQLRVNDVSVQPASKILKRRRPLPNWVYPDWTQTFLPTLTHALFISEDPFQEFKSSSPAFIVIVQQISRLVYPDAPDDISVLVEEAAQRLTTKKSKIACAVMEEVKHFFKQERYLSHPDQIGHYAKWALRPDGPAFHETPTPITCKVDRSHKQYIRPRGTFQSPFINRIAKQFLFQVKDSILEPPISASNPPKGLYGLLLVSVERAFTAFKSGSFKKPKSKFCYEEYGIQLKTYICHLSAVSPPLWEEILGRADAADLDRVKEDKRVDEDNRRNLYIPENI